MEELVRALKTKQLTFIFGGHFQPISYELTTCVQYVHDQRRLPSAELAYYFNNLTFLNI